MPPIRQAIGAHTVREQVQIDPGVSVNMFPELGERASEFQARPRLFQLSTHGYERFVTDNDPGSELPPVTGMVGSREADERLVVANGRTLRVFSDPGAKTPTPDALTVTGHPGRTIRPVFGAALVGSTYYWVTERGTLRRQAAGQTTDVELPDLDVTLRGLASQPNAGGSDAVLLFFSCVEDRVIRCWSRDSVTGAFSRQARYDLDLGDTAVNSPESLWMDVSSTTVGARTFRRMLVVDAVGGRILEYEFEELADQQVPPRDTWTLSTPPGVSNPLNLQRLVGDTETQEPVTLGGVWANETEIRIANRATGLIVALDRNTGVLSGSQTIRAVPAAFTACGAVGSQSAALWFVNGAQTNGFGRIYRGGAEASGVRLPDSTEAHPDPTPLVPLGDDGRLVGWVVDRRLHVLDLRENRLITNVEGSIDSLTYATGRLIAADASTGFLKVSPVDQIDVEPGERYGTPVAAASIRVPGWPRRSPATITSVFVGIRTVLAVANNQLWRYQRANMDAAPVQISGDANVRAVCAAGDQVAVIQGLQQQQRISVRLYDVPPTTRAEFDAAGHNNINTPVTYPSIFSWASDGTRLFMVYGSPRRLQANTISNGQFVNGLNISNQSGSDALFEGLEFGSTRADDWLRGITFVNGVLLMAIRQEAPNPTVVRAFEFDPMAQTFSWVRAAARDLTTQASTDNAMLAHDANFVFDAAAELVDDELGDGTPVKSLVVAAFRGGLSDRLSKYAWDPTQSSRTGAHSVAAVRRSLYAWTRTGMEIRDLSDATQGFPYFLTATRTVGLVAPRSVAVVADVLHWLGVTDGGGIRVWRIGHEGDIVPRPVEGKAIEEMLTRIARMPGGVLADCIGYGDDTGGHPTYVLHSAAGGISMAFDADAMKWHCRSSVRATPLAESGRIWPWLGLNQGAQRVTHSTTWRTRLVCGGYTTDLRGVVAFASPTDWRDIDGGRVLRVRQFGTMGTERRIVRVPVLRIDAVYGQGAVYEAGEEAPGPADVDPRFTLHASDDGGKTFVAVGQRSLGPEGGRPSHPFYRLGISRQRVYRLECDASVPFVLMGAYMDTPSGRVSGRV